MPVIDKISDFKNDMTSIHISEHFNEPIENIVWPSKTQQISFAWNFNQSIYKVVWPNSLEKIIFCSNYKNSINKVIWPSSLKQIVFFTKEKISITSFLEQFDKITIICNNFNLKIETTNLKIYGGILLNLEIPLNMEEIIIYYDEELPKIKVPYGCKYETHKI